MVGGGHERRLCWVVVWEALFICQHENTMKVLRCLRSATMPSEMSLRAATMRTSIEDARLDGGRLKVADR